jgi:hypothetical protein
MRMTKEAVSVKVSVGIRLPAGTRDRIKAERGDMSEPEWLRSVVLDEPLMRRGFSTASPTRILKTFGRTSSGGRRERDGMHLHGTVPGAAVYVFGRWGNPPGTGNVVARSMGAL